MTMTFVTINIAKTTMYKALVTLYSRHHALAHGILNLFYN
jgi:hypothetical protein